MRYLAVVIVLLAHASLASADAIDGPPPCPPGAHGRSAHEGQWCVVATCEAGCDASEHCAERRVCTAVASVVPGGLRPSAPPAEPRELVIATCDPSSACTGMEEPPPPIVGTLPDTAPTCTTMQVCVPRALPSLPITAPTPSPETAAATPPPATAPPRSCLCSAPGGARGSSLAMLVALALVASKRRR